VPYPTPDAIGPVAAKIEGVVFLDAFLWSVLAGQLSEASQVNFWDDSKPGSMAADDVAEVVAEFARQLMSMVIEV